MVCGECVCQRGARCRQTDARMPRYATAPTTTTTNTTNSATAITAIATATGAWLIVIDIGRRAEYERDGVDANAHILAGGRVRNLRVRERVVGCDERKAKN